MNNFGEYAPPSANTSWYPIVRRSDILGGVLVVLKGERRQSADDAGQGRGRTNYRTGGADTHNSTTS
jgi:hypothetical protein